MGKYCAPGGTLAISDNWAAHRARGSLGGTDYLDGYNTPIRAMADGVVVMVDSNPDGSGGRMITIRHHDSDSTEVLHADRWIVTRGTVVSQGQIVGYSGGSGFGKDRYYGSHTHAHGNHSNGARFDVQPHVQHVHSLTAPAAGGTTTTIPKGRHEMRLVWAAGTGYLVTEDGFHGLASPQIYNLFFRLINSNQANSPFGNGATPDIFNRLEIDMMNAQLKLVATSVQTQISLDSIKLASAISDELVKRGIPVTVANLQDAKFKVDDAQLAIAFDAAVPRVAKALLKQQGALLGAIN